MKDSFTKEEYESLIILISKKEKADKEIQKQIRKQIRKIGFYFSKYSSKKGYNINDFENLIKNGKITISGKEIKSNSKKLNVPEKQTEIKIIGDLSNISKIEFSDFKNLLIEDLNKTGIYCIRLKVTAKLPEKYQNIIESRNNNLIYIGIAKGQTLKERLDQEVYHKSPGTFFRSIGTVLQFNPIPGHLRDKSNKKNYKFYPQDTVKITNWLLKNTEFYIHPILENFIIEKDLIKKYCPLLNDTHNPLKLTELKLDRKNCRKIAVGE